MKFNVTSELISATSSLNTEVTYGKPEEFIYISDAEPLVSHSIEHIHAAIEVLTEVRGSIDDIRTVFSQILKKHGIWDDLPIQDRARIDSVIHKAIVKL